MQLYIHINIKITETFQKKKQKTINVVIIPELLFWKVEKYNSLINQTHDWAGSGIIYTS